MEDIVIELITHSSGGWWEPQRLMGSRGWSQPKGWKPPGEENVLPNPRIWGYMVGMRITEGAAAECSWGRDGRNPAVSPLLVPPAFYQWPPRLQQTRDKLAREPRNAVPGDAERSRGRRAEQGTQRRKTFEHKLAKHQHTVQDFFPCHLKSSQIPVKT